MKTKNIDSQLEMPLPTPHRRRSLHRPQRRHRRASFWFARMRQVVENAPDWPTLPTNKSTFVTSNLCSSLD